VIDRSLLVLVNGESALCDQPTTMAAVVMLSAGAMEQHHTVARDLDEKVCRLDFMHDVVTGLRHHRPGDVLPSVDRGSAVAPGLSCGSPRSTVTPVQRRLQQRPHGLCVLVHHRFERFPLVHAVSNQLTFANLRVEI
jgi:hypothetical protein